MFMIMFLSIIAAIFASPMHSRVSVQDTAGYARSTIQFDPMGRIIQTENARELVRTRGGPVIAVKCSDGILVVTVVPNVSTGRFNLKRNFYQKISFAAKSICLISSGLLSDAIPLVNIARDLCAEHRAVYDSDIPISKLSHELADVLHRCTCDSELRPLSISCAVVGSDAFGLQIYRVDSDGRCTSCNALALGSKSIDVEQALEDVRCKLRSENEHSVDACENTDTTRNSNKNTFKKGNCIGTLRRTWSLLKRRVLKAHFLNVENVAGSNTCRGGSGDSSISSSNFIRDSGGNESCVPAMDRSVASYVEDLHGMVSTVSASPICTRSTSNSNSNSKVQDDQMWEVKALAGIIYDDARADENGHCIAAEDPEDQREADDATKEEEEEEEREEMNRIDESLPDRPSGSKLHWYCIATNTIDDGENDDDDDVGEDD